MKLFCNGLDLSSAVLKVVRATSPKNFNPILEGIKLIANDETLTLIATDGDLAIEKKINADVKVNGETVVPGKFFSDFVKKLTSGDIELELNEKNQLKIRYTDSETSIQCLNPKEYPDIKTVGSAEYIKIKELNLKRAIDKTVFAVETDDLRPALKGVLFEVTDNNIITVALDGYRLSKDMVQIEEKSSDFKIVFPARALKEVSNLLSENENVITVNIERNYVMVEVDDTKVVSRLIDEEFVNYKRIIPSGFSTVIKVNKALLENSLDQGIILARLSNDNKIELGISEKLLSLKTVSEIGNWKDNLSIILSGNDLEINFNLMYIRECLRVIDDEIVKFSFSSQTGPCVVQGENDENYLYLILPLRRG